MAGGKDCIMEQESFMTKLFEADLDEVLRIIFLNLDPKSLKNSRCVSRQWDSFILHRLWGSRVGREKLRKKLDQNWMEKPQVAIGWVEALEGEVVALACDTERVYCALSTRAVRIIRLDTCAVETLLQEDLATSTATTLVAATATSVVSVSEAGTRAWRTGSWEVEQEEALQSQAPRVLCLASTGSTVVAGRSDGSLALWQAGGWTRATIRPSPSPVLGLGCLGALTALATRDHVRVVDLGTGATLASLPEGAGGAVLLQGPCSTSGSTPASSSLPRGLDSLFLATVGEAVGWQGLKVWSLAGRLVREVTLHGRSFAQIATNGRQVAVMECDPNSDEADDNFVFVFDTQELCCEKVPTDKLRSRVRIYERSEPRACLAMSPTSLLLSNGPRVNVQNFWA